MLRVKRGSLDGVSRSSAQRGEARAEAVAPVRKLRGAFLAAEDRNGGRGALAPNSAVVIRRTRHSSRPLRRSPRRNLPRCSLRQQQGARCRTAAPESTSSRVAAARCPTKVGQPRWSSTTATSSRSAPSRSMVRTKLCPVGAEEPRAPHDPRSFPGCGLAVELRPAVGGQRARAVGLDVRRSFAAVEDVVGGVGDERRAELRGVRSAADVDLGGALRIVLGAVDVRPGCRVQHEVRTTERRRRGEPHVPVGVGQRSHVVRRERRRERRAELAARAGDQDAPAPCSQPRGRAAERIGRPRAPQVLHARIVPGDAVLVGIAGSYSSVTW